MTYRNPNSSQWSAYDKSYEASFIHFTHISNLQSILAEGIKVSSNNAVSGTPVAFFVNPLHTHARQGLVTAAGWASRNGQSRLSTLSLPNGSRITNPHVDGIAAITVRTLVGPYSPWFKARPGTSYDWKAISVMNVPAANISAVTLHKDLLSAERSFRA